MSRKILEAVIRKLLSEAAVATSAAASQGLALYANKSGNNVLFVLYNPKQFQVFFENEGSPASMSNDDVPGGIVAYFQLAGGPADSCSGAFEVSVSSAIKGYGPMMYDICMSYVYPTPIMPDRSNVTAAAANVWKYYLRRNDVEKLQLSDNDCNLSSDEDLNFAYRGKPANFSSLIANHETFVKTLGQNANVFLKNIMQVGVQFFDSVY